MITSGNGLEEMIKGLERAKAEAIMNSWPHDKLDAAILKFKRKLEDEKKTPLNDE